MCSIENSGKSHLFFLVLIWFESSFSLQHLLNEISSETHHSISNIFQSAYLKVILFCECRCGLQRPSMMSLAPQLFTGNASNCAKRQTKISHLKQILYHEKASIQVVAEFLFLFILHFHSCLFLYVCYVGIWAWRRAKYDQYSIILLLLCREIMYCYWIGLVESKIPFDIIYFSRKLVPFMSDDFCISDIKTVILYIIFMGTEVTDKLLIEYVPND